MLNYFKFRQDLFDPQPAQEVYLKRGAGKGWPEECPPIRAANAFGFDILANFDATFIRTRAGWRVEPDVVLESDFDWSANDQSPGAPLKQQYAWFWERGQTIPHTITDNVWEQISNQVKVSSFLYLATDPNELLYMTAIPNLHRPWNAITALIDTDWYPASYPWHGVIELDRDQKRIEIRKGEPLFRLIPVRRDAYFARQMSPAGFDEFFERGQRWLATHGRPKPARPAAAAKTAQGNSAHEDPHDGTLDITRTYVRQQIKSKFVVMT